MRLNAPAGIHVVKKEEKEEKLRLFIERTLAADAGAALAGQSAPLADGQRLTLLARSVHSPVVRALASLSDGFEHAGISIDAILVEAPRPTDTAMVRLFHSLRLITDPRYLEAHEQLVIDGTTAWIGDCMRREPNERDAFERYATDCAPTSQWAGRAFERLFSRAVPFDATACAHKAGARAC